MWKVGCLVGSVQSESPWTVIYSYDAAYHFDDEQVDEILQEEELPTSFVVEPGVALDLLVGDGDDVIILEKRKR
jgi:hypothetical protein